MIAVAVREEEISRSALAKTFNMLMLSSDDFAPAGRVASFSMGRISEDGRRPHSKGNNGRSRACRRSRSAWRSARLSFNRLSNPAVSCCGGRCGRRAHGGPAPACCVHHASCMHQHGKGGCAAGVRRPQFGSCAGVRHTAQRPAWPHADGSDRQVRWTYHQTGSATDDADARNSHRPCWSDK